MQLIPIRPATRSPTRRCARSSSQRSGCSSSRSCRLSRSSSSCARQRASARARRSPSRRAPLRSSAQSPCARPRIRLDSAAARRRHARVDQRRLAAVLGPGARTLLRLPPRGAGPGHTRAVPPRPPSRRLGRVRHGGGCSCCTHCWNAAAVAVMVVGRSCRMRARGAGAGARIPRLRRHAARMPRLGRRSSAVRARWFSRSWHSGHCHDRLACRGRRGQSDRARSRRRARSARHVRTSCRDARVLVGPGGRAAKYEFQLAADRIRVDRRSGSDGLVPDRNTFATGRPDAGRRHLLLARAGDRRARPRRPLVAVRRSSRAGRTPRLCKSPRSGATVDVSRQPARPALVACAAAYKYRVTIATDRRWRTRRSATALGVETSGTAFALRRRCPGTYYWAVTPLDAGKHPGRARRSDRSPGRGRPAPRRGLRTFVRSSAAGPRGASFL